MSMRVRDFDIPEFKPRKFRRIDVLRTVGFRNWVRYIYIGVGRRRCMKTFAEDIKWLLASRNLSVTRFARLVGVKYDPVRFYGTGENGYLDERTRRKIEAGLSVLRENESLVAPLWNKRYNVDTSYTRYILAKREHEGLVEAFESEFKRLFELRLGEIDVLA